jgi:hypothetical protein
VPRDHQASEIVTIAIRERVQAPEKSAWVEQNWPACPPEHIEKVSIERHVEDAPMTLPCTECDGSAHRMSATYEVPYTDAAGQPALVQCPQVPAYRCERCGTTTYDVIANVSSLHAALTVVDAAGDVLRANQLRASLTSVEQLLSEPRPANL